MFENFFFEVFSISKETLLFESISNLCKPEGVLKVFSSPTLLLSKAFAMGEIQLTWPFSKFVSSTPTITISSISSLTTNFSFAQQGMEGVIPSRGRGVAFFYITLNPPPRQRGTPTTKGWTGWAGTPGMYSSTGSGQLKLVIDTNLYLAFLFNKEWNH